MQLLSDSKTNAEVALSTANLEEDEKLLLEKTEELQEQLDTLETEKEAMIQSTLTKLAEERAKEKESLLE